MDDKILAEVIEKLEMGLGDEYRVDMTCQTKNNGVKKTGVSTCRVGENVGAIYYISDFMNSNKSVDDIVVEIMHDYFSASSDIKLINDCDALHDLMDFDRSQIGLFPRLISKDKNIELLKTVPYKDFLDLAVIVTYEFKDADGVMSVKIDQPILKYWGVTFDDVYNIALHNMQKCDKWDVCSMQDVLLNLSGQIYLNDINMYVASIEGGVNGARCLLNDAIINHLVKEFNGSFIVLPSSIHEVIILPNNESSFSLSDFDDLVHTVNVSDAICSEDVLSDHAYIYDSEKGWSW